MRDELESVVVIGGGLSGLTAALHVAERGLKPLVLEADEQFPGGRIAGGEMVEVDGWQFRAEHGVHGIWSPYRNLQAMLGRHGIRPAFVPAQEETWIYRKNGKVKRADVGSALRRSWIPAPLHYLALFIRPRFLRMLGWRDWLSLPLVWYSLILAVGIDPLAENQALAGMYLTDFTRGWSDAIRSFCIGLARNSLSGTPDEVPLSGFIAFLRYYTLLRRDSWGFSYLPGDGGTSLIDPLVAKVQELGGEIRLGTAVTHLSRIESNWHIHTNGETLSAKHVILATDPDNAHKLVEASADLADDTADFYWPAGRETAVVRLWFKRAAEAKSGAEGGMLSGEFIIDNYFWLDRIQDQYRAWQRETGGSVLEVHLYGPPDVLAQSDAVLLTRVITDVQSAFPELRGALLHQTLQRNTVNHTLFGVGPAGRHLAVQTPWPNISCCGDWVYDANPSFFLERAAFTGIEAANKVLQAEDLPPWPTVAYPPPERFAAFLERVMRGGRGLLRRRKRDD
jgi:isorenieratene synthase